MANPNIAVVYDSASSMPPEIDSYDGMYRVPLSVISRVDNSIQPDTPFIDDSERQQFLAELAPDRFTTSQPNPSDYRTVYEQAIDKGAKEIVVIPLSAKLSKSMDRAQDAADDLKNRGTKANIIVADCRTASIGQSLLATQAYIEASQAAKQGIKLNAEQLAERVEYLAQNKLVVAQVFSSLEYVKQGGRIGSTLGRFASGLLQIRAVVGLNSEGELEKISITRKDSAAQQEMLKLVMGRVGTEPARLAYLHLGTNQLESFQTLCAGNFVLAPAQYDIENPIVCEESKVLGIHSGPKVYGIGVLAVGEGWDLLAA